MSILVKNPKFLIHEKDIIIPPVPPFRLGSFFKEDGNPLLHLGDNFRIDILKGHKNLTVSSGELCLSQFKLKDSNAKSFNKVYSDLNRDPQIPILTFLPLLKGLIELNSKMTILGEYKNIFSLDLSTLNIETPISGFDYIVNKDAQIHCVYSIAIIMEDRFYPFDYFYCLK